MWFCVINYGYWKPCLETFLMFLKFYKRLWKAIVVLFTNSGLSARNSWNVQHHWNIFVYCQYKKESIRRLSFVSLYRNFRLLFLMLFEQCFISSAQSTPATLPNRMETFLDDVVLRHTLPVFTGLGRCPIVSWDFAGAVSILDQMPFLSSTNDLYQD